MKIPQHSQESNKENNASKLRLPVNVRLRMPLQRTDKQREFVFDNSVSEDIKNTSIWEVIAIKKKSLIYIVVTDSVVQDISNNLVIAGNAKFPKLNQINKVDSGWFWRDKFNTGFTESNFKYSNSRFVGGNFIRYLKLEARAFVTDHHSLEKSISDLNQLEHSTDQELLLKSNTKGSVSNLLQNPTLLKEALQTLKVDQTEKVILPAATKIDKVANLSLVVVKPNSFGAEYATGANKDIAARLSGGLIKAMAPSPSVESLDRLYVEFPNFSGVLDKIKRRLFLAKRSCREVAFHLPRPILMIGAPGIGKTIFGAALANALALPVRSVDFSVQTASFVLTGSSCQWAESKQGMIADELIMRSTVANPLFILNEVDKVSLGERSPLGALLGLLDATSAEFVDEFIGCDFPINASQINYLLTANTLDNLSDPLLTRVDVEWIPSPTFEQKKQIGRHIYKKLMDAPWGSSFPDELSEESLIELAASDNPREMSGRLDAAIGSAAERSANEVEPRDFSSIVKKTKSIGFS